MLKISYLITGVQNTDGIVGEADYFGDIYKEKLTKAREAHFTCRCVHTYLLTPWSRVLHEKLTGSAASQEIPPIYGTRRFLTVPTSARHLSLS